MYCSIHTTVHTGNTYSNTPGLCILYSSSESTVFLVWKSGLTFEGARAKGRRGIGWMRLCSDGDTLGFLPRKDRIVVARPSTTLGRLPLIPAGDTTTVTHSMHGVMPASYPGGACDTVDHPGSSSALFYINSWAMVFPSDHPADWEPNLEHEAAAKTDCGALNAKRRKAWYQYVHKQYQQLQYRPIRTEYMQNHNIRVNTYQNTYPIRTNTTGARPKPVC